MYATTPMIGKKVPLFLLVLGVLVGTSLYAKQPRKTDKAQAVPTQKLLRFTDTKEKYGKSCEVYSYINPSQRLQLIRHREFMLGDILSDTLSIPPVDRSLLVETNLTNCDIEGMDTSEYIYNESLEYFSEHIATLKIYQYQYGAGTAHGDSHISRYVYDREYGMRLDWVDLFGATEAFDLYVLKRVVKEIADEDFISYFKTNEQLLNFRRPGYFAITDEGLLIQYGKYEITPGASGLPSITVPRKVLRQYMSQEKYQKYFMTRTELLAEMLNEF
jgi:hypothetical protein